MNMIEVEKKFILTDNQLKAITKLAKFVRQMEFTDVYFDTRDRWLTLHDKWLRRRGDRFELKVPIPGVRQSMNVYREIENPRAIARELRLKSLREDVAENLAANGLRPFCTIASRRTFYRYRGFTIDIARMDFGYTIGEIEKIVRAEKNIPRATEEILALAVRLGLEAKPVYDKVIEYLRRYDLRHFRALRKAGIIT